jgi:acyl-[acyl carrier protein]--UDP-N-acetylglucosamine O-acyltransferase
MHMLSASALRTSHRFPRILESSFVGAANPEPADVPDTLTQRERGHVPGMTIRGMRERRETDKD